MRVDILTLFPDLPSWFRPPYITFTAALVLLGLSAAFGGPWVERRGPRVAATTAALFFGAGLLIGGVGLSLKQPVLVFVGMGLIGGVGCGLGYISPVSTLVKWFPDRRGMATGMAIMGFGGGAALDRRQAHPRALAEGETTGHLGGPLAGVPPWSGESTGHASGNVARVEVGVDGGELAVAIRVEPHRVRRA